LPQDARGDRWSASRTHKSPRATATGSAAEGRFGAENRRYCEDDMANVEIASARAADLYLRWAPNIKLGLSAEWYAFYSAALTFAQFDLENCVGL
jgi:hypothetical protein